MMNDMAKESDIKGTSNKRLVPELRFPKFEKEGEWKKMKLGEISNIINEKCKVKDLKIETYISTENILKDYAGITQIAKLPQTGSFTLFSKGDILVANIRPYLKKIWIADFDGAASNDVIVFRSNENMNNSYVSHLIKNDEFVNYCMAGAKGVKMPRGDKEMMINYSVPTPSSIDEQQKIAECLSSIDEEISAMKEKVEQLKIHKKGLMQKLFPAAGKFVPELRFPEFKNDGGWKKVILGEAFERISEKNVNNNRNVLTISAQYGLVSQYDYFNKNVAAANIKNYYFIHKEDFAYNKSRSQGYPFGVIKSLRRYESGVVSTLYICFRAKTNCCIDFYEQYFDTDLINDEISKIAQEGARNHGLLNISIDDFFNKINILVPHSSEQQKIAECLSSIDELISLYENKVTLQEQHKKGLMQQLFPKL